jgi:hypothetical protein
MMSPADYRNVKGDGLEQDLGDELKTKLDAISAPPKKKYPIP